MASMTELPKLPSAPSELIQNTYNVFNTFISSLLQDDREIPLSNMLSDRIESSWDSIRQVDSKLRKLLLTIETLNACLDDAKSWFSKLENRRSAMLEKLRQEEEKQKSCVNLPPEIISYICSLSSDLVQLGDWKDHDWLRAWGPYLFQSVECRVDLQDLVFDPLAKTTCARYSRVLVAIKSLDLDLENGILKPAMEIVENWSGVELDVVELLYDADECSTLLGSLQQVMPYLRKLIFLDPLTNSGPELRSHQDCCLGCRSGFKLPLCTHAQLHMQDIQMFPCMLPSLSFLSVTFSDTSIGTFENTFSGTTWPLVHTLELTDDFQRSWNPDAFKPNFFTTSRSIDIFPNLRTLIVINYDLECSVVQGLIQSLHCPKLESLIVGDLTHALADMSVKYGLNASMMELVDAIDKNFPSLQQLKFYIDLSDVHLENRRENTNRVNSAVLSALTPQDNERVLIPSLLYLALPYDENWHDDPFEIFYCLSSRRGRKCALNTLELSASSSADFGAGPVFCGRLGLYVTNLILSADTTSDFYGV